MSTSTRISQHFTPPPAIYPFTSTLYVNNANHPPLYRWLPDNRVGLTLHFLLHGVHHYLPMDKYRLVMPPTLFVVLATPFWKLAHAIFYWHWHTATAVFCGGIFGYICYDLTHYFLHHQNLPLWYRELKKYHLAHHFLDYELGFGVTSKVWDRVFGTELATSTDAAKGKANAKVNGKAAAANGMAKTK